MKVVSFYTNEKYRQYAEHLIRSGSSVGVEVLAYEMPDKGSWAANVNHKPHVVMKAMEEYPDHSILYLDTDAEFIQAPKAFHGLDADFAAYYNSPIQPCGGCLWFHNSRKVKDCVEAWIENVELRPHHADDYVNLFEALKAHRLLIHHLPPAYNWHEETHRRRFPTAKPIIRHFCKGEHTYIPSL